MWAFAVTAATLATASAETPAAAASPMRAVCTLVTGGGGTVTAKAQVARWFAINRTVTEGVIEMLKSKGYAVEALILGIRDPNERLRALSRELERDKCTQVLQITHALNQDPASFSFSARVIHAVANWPAAGAKRGVAFVGDYEQQYSYPLTAETTAKAALAELSAKLVADIEAAQVLKSRKP